MIQAAQAQLVEAENNLKQTQAFADDLLVRIEGKNRELADFNERLKKFGGTVLDAYHQFQEQATQLTSPGDPASAEETTDQP
jgi:hypothetical protein